MLSNLFLMMRHGQTKLNDMEAYRGWSNGPDADLNGKGLQAAIDGGFYLSKMRSPIRKVICSDLNRTINTASIVCTILGIPTFDVDKRLRPLHVGDLAGQNKEKNPIDKYLADKNLRFPNGETVNEFEKRQHEVATEIINWIMSGKVEANELLIIAHVSNIMYWQNVQMGKDSDEYLHETTDLVKPGGLVIVTDESVIPILKWSPIAVDLENAMEGDKKMAVS